MGSSTFNHVSEKQLEDELIDTGSRLLMLPSATSELLILLEKAERLLTKVRQQPPRSTGNALLPVLKALVSEDLLRHSDVNIQVAVASCINELTRITAPNPPYEDAEMKEVFQLFTIAFRQLSCEPGPKYSRAVQILETVAKVRSCLILLDIDCDALVVEMFHLFFTTIRSDHPSNIMKHMEIIITLLIEESDEISLELLRPLLNSVKMENKTSSPVSWELGRTIFRTCASKLESPLREAVRKMNLDVDDYAEILSSICKTNGKNVAKEVISPAETDTAVAGVSVINRLSNIDPDNKTPPTKGDIENEHLLNSSAKHNVKGVDAAGLVQLEMNKGAIKKRGRKPNSLIDSKDGYEGKDSCDGKSEEDLALSSKLEEGSFPNDSSLKKDDSVNAVIRRKRGRPKKKESMIDQKTNVELSSTSKRSLDTEKSTDKKSPTGSRTMRVKKEENLDNEMNGKDALLLQESPKRKENISQKDDSADVYKMVKSVSSSRIKTNNSPLKTEKKFGSSPVDYGKKLVNMRIRVWWPMDKEFYAGTVEAYDPLTKKHKIKYDDEEEETLNLRKERWEILTEQKSGKARLLKKLEASQLSPAKEIVKALEKTGKRKSISSGKEDGTSSSKRQNGERRKVFKPVENSAPDDVHQKDEQDIESETKLTSKDGGNHALKEELETATN